MDRLELQPVLTVVDPTAGGDDELTSIDDGRVPDHHPVTLSARFDLQHAEAVLGVVVGDAFPTLTASRSERWCHCLALETVLHVPPLF